MTCSVEQVCQSFGVSRQAYYKRQKRSVNNYIEKQVILDAVREIRRKQPRIGVRKLHRMLSPRFQEKGIKIGRDALFNLLREEKLLVSKRRNHTRTTQSYHRFRTYKNLIRDLKITRPNQVFVSDITYIDTFEGFCYLALVTDVYSRKIVGYQLSQSLSIEFCLKALKQALKGVINPQMLIHHSDRGIQYCSHAYVKLLKKNKVQISMTEKDHVYENSIAERVNGILKHEFLLGERLSSFTVAKKLVQQSIRIYNEQRPHMSLDYSTPELKYAASWRCPVFFQVTDSCL